MKRFITEYANYKLDMLEKAHKNGLPDSKYYETGNKITRTVRNLELGLITIDECMKELANIINGD